MFNTQAPLLIGHAPLFGRDGCLLISDGSMFNRDRRLFIGGCPVSSCGAPLLNTRHSVFALEACLLIRRRSMFSVRVRNGLFGVVMVTRRVIKTLNSFDSPQPRRIEQESARSVATFWLGNL
ncbi:hypothetical protein [Methylomonas sp. LWB]|uniref:hypothetical protein n=1 Tax=Methylomonas sp. LWB TaxID=1905845 RepID=UPI001115069F|nr:hypothetical protein [Methylomonas sp. LWB]